MGNLERDAAMTDPDDNFQPLKKGIYRFAVNGKPLVWGESKGVKTLGAPMAKLELTIYDPEDVEYKTPIGVGFDRIIRHTLTEYWGCQFFVCIGERKHGETITPAWDMVPSATGRAVFFPENFEGKISMKVEAYLDPQEEAAPENF